MLSSIVDKLIDLYTDYQRKKAKVNALHEEVRNTCLLSRYIAAVDELETSKQDAEMALNILFSSIEELKSL